MRVLVVALLLAASLAGCADDPAPVEDDGPTLVTDPTDLQAGNSSGEHLHDYWGGLTELTVVEAVEETGSLWIGGASVLAQARPTDDHVVPQGTSYVDVTVSWDEPQAPDAFSEPQLWVQTAAQNEPQFIDDLSNGATVRVETTNEDNDLPHQILSAWLFQLVVSQPNAAQPAKYDGEVTFVAVAHRGLEIPVYPGHPDRWEGATEFRLFDAEKELQIYEGQGYSDRWTCYNDCPDIHAPDDGVIIPIDSDRVEVELTLTHDTPLRLGLAYHAADGWEWLFPEPASGEGTTRHYVLPVTGAMGDGPYAKQSLWRFAPYIEEPEPDGATVQGYSITATVYKDPA